MSEKSSKFNFPSSPTGGVKPLAIRGIFEDQHRRLSEDFTDDERLWRKQWLKDQVLSPNEPRPPSEEWIKLTRNPIRRFLSKPWEVMERKMAPVTGNHIAAAIRYVVPKTIVGVMAVYVFWYHMKYNQNDWTRGYGVKITMPKKVLFPGDPGFPAERERFQPSDYYNQGFKDRKVFLDLAAKTY